MKISVCDYNVCFVNKKYFFFVKFVDCMRIKFELIFFIYFYIMICMKMKGDYVFCMCLMCFGFCMFCSVM